MKALIAGGGIGGLATAIALCLHGWEVRVFEQADALEEVGAGVQISPNGWRVLEALGMSHALQPFVFQPEAIEMRLGRSGRRVFHLPIKDTAQDRWGAPYMHVHRADLADALAARLRTLAGDVIRTGHRVARYTQTDAGASLHFEGQDTQTGDIVIAADGLHSVVRGQMHGADTPNYTGNVAWRAVVPMDALGDHAPPPTACVWAGDKRHAVTTRLRASTMANFVGMIEQAEPAPEGWRISGTRSDALAAFAGWDPVITGLIKAAPALNRWALFDRAPLPFWHEGRVALMGDAAHPMLPSMAQGAVQAIEDAWILAAALDAHADAEKAFEAYFNTRIARTSRIQKGSLANARLFHKGSALGQLAFYGPMAVGARLFPGIIHARQDWVYRYDATRAL
ncbi:MAG: FAD-dependent monooxygenase [Pseudomonadota bacterium]